MINEEPTTEIWCGSRLWNRFGQSWLCEERKNHGNGKSGEIQVHLHFMSETSRRFLKSFWVSVFYQLVDGTYTMSVPLSAHDQAKLRLDMSTIRHCRTFERWSWAKNLMEWMKIWHNKWFDPTPGRLSWKQSWSSVMFKSTISEFHVAKPRSDRSSVVFLGVSEGFG